MPGMCILLFSPHSDELHSFVCDATLRNHPKSFLSLSLILFISQHESGITIAWPQIGLSLSPYFSFFLSFCFFSSDIFLSFHGCQ